MGGGSSNRLLGNLIGTNQDGVSPLGNSQVGVLVAGNSGDKIGDGTAAGANTIAFSGRDGVAILPGDNVANRITRNSIFSNGELGRDLSGTQTDAAGSTPNDGDDPNTPQVDPDGDTGPNHLQNKPVITSAKNTSATAISGKLNSQANTSYTIEFFSNWVAAAFWWLIHAVDGSLSADESSAAIIRCHAPWLLRDWHLLLSPE